MPDMKIRTWCLETIPIRTYSTSSHSNLVNRTYCPKPSDIHKSSSCAPERDFVGHIFCEEKTNEFCEDRVIVLQPQLYIDF